MFLLRCSEYASEADDSLGKHVIKRFHDSIVVFKRNGVVTTNPVIADQVEITIPSSKTDQQGQGHTRTHYKTHGVLCPVRLLAEWMCSTNNMPSGAPLFSFLNLDVQEPAIQSVTALRHLIARPSSARETNVMIMEVCGRGFGTESNPQPYGPGPKKIECAGAHFDCAPIRTYTHLCAPIRIIRTVRRAFGCFFEPRPLGLFCSH